MLFRDERVILDEPGSLDGDPRASCNTHSSAGPFQATASFLPHLQKRDLDCFSWQSTSKTADIMMGKLCLTGLVQQGACEDATRKGEHASLPPPGQTVRCPVRDSSQIQLFAVDLRRPSLSFVSISQVFSHQSRAKVNGRATWNPFNAQEFSG